MSEVHLTYELAPHSDDNQKADAHRRLHILSRPPPRGTAGRRRAELRAALFDDRAESDQAVEHPLTEAGHCTTATPTSADGAAGHLQTEDTGDRSAYPVDVNFEHDRGDFLQYLLRTVSRKSTFAQRVRHPPQRAFRAAVATDLLGGSAETHIPHRRR